MPMQYGNAFGVNPYSMPNPYQQFQQPGPAPINGLTQVVGLEGAKEYKTPLNSTIPLFDSNDAVFYVKTTDAMGNSNVRTFDFTEREEPEEPRYVTQDQFESLRNLILEAMNGKSVIPEAQQATAEPGGGAGDEPAKPAKATRRRKPAGGD